MKTITAIRWLLKTKMGTFRKGRGYPFATYDTRADAKDDAFEGDVPVRVRLTLTAVEIERA